MKKSLLFYGFLMLIFSLSSCADKYGRAINKHFNKFILIDELEDYKITKIKTYFEYEEAKKIEQELKNIAEIKKKIYSLENDWHIKYKENRNYEISQRDYSVEVWEQEVIANNKEIVEIAKRNRNQIEQLNIDLLKKEKRIGEIRDVKNKKIYRVFSAVSIEGITKNGTDEKIFDVVQDEDGKILNLE